MQTSDNLSLNSKIGLWGGSCAVRIPKAAVEKLGLKEGEDVHISIRDGAIMIEPSRPKYTLEELVEQAKGQTPPESWDDGPVGKEIL